MRALAASAIFSLLVTLATPLGAAELDGTIVGVADGDTVTLLDASKTQHRIRIDGIDAPERTQPHGQRARQSLAALAHGRSARGLPKGRSLWTRRVSRNRRWCRRWARTDPARVCMALRQVRARAACGRPRKLLARRERGSLGQRRAVVVQRSHSALGLSPHIARRVGSSAKLLRRPICACGAQRRAWRAPRRDLGPLATFQSFR